MRTAQPLLVLLLASALAAVDGMAPLPIVSASARSHGRTGGEGCQIILSIAWGPDGQQALMSTDVGGVWRSSNAGVTWTPANTGLKGRGGPEIAFDPANADRAFLVSSNSGSNSWDWQGLYRSLDAGRTWSQLPQVGSVNCTEGGVGGSAGHSLAFDPTSVSSGVTQRLWWSTPSPDTVAGKRGLWRSTDAGSTWTRVNTNLTDGLVVCDGSGNVWYGGASGLWRIPSGGDPAAPQQVTTTAVTSLDWSANAPSQIVYTMGAQMRIRQTASGTETTPACAGLPTSGGTWAQLRISPASAQRMIVSQDTGTYFNQPRYVTNNGGASWTSVSVNATDLYMPQNGRPLNAAWHPTDPLQVLDGYDYVVRSSNGGSSFAYSNDGYNAVFVCSVFPIQPTTPDLLIVSSQDYNGSLSTDNGHTWSYFDPLNNGWGGYTYGSVALNNSVIAVGSTTYWNGPRTIYVSRNGGASWTATTATWTGGNDPAWASDTSLVDPRDTNIAFLGRHRTTDGGLTWNVMNGCKGVFTWNRANSAELFGCADASGTSLVMSTDHGATWSTLSGAALSGEVITDIAYDHTRNLMYVARGERHIDLWTRSSGTWTDLTSRFPVDNQGERRGNTVAVDPVDTSVVYVGSRGNYYRTDVALLRSLDAGATWTNLTLTAAQAAAGGIDGANEVMCVRVHPVTREAIITTNCFGIWRLAPPGTPSDTAPPATPAAPTTSSTSSATPTLSGTTEAGATVRIYDGATQIGSATANGSGAWTFTVSPALAVGTHSLTVTATDAAGNVSASSPARTVTVAPAPANTAPTISTLSNQTITEDTATAAKAVTIGDAETAVGSLTLTATAADTTLLPGSGITVGGSGANRTVTLTPAADRNGSTVVTLTVGDGTTTTSSTFTLTVTAVNDAPRLGTSLATVTGEVGIAVDVILPAGAFVDVDGDALTWAMSSLPAGLTFDPATRRLSGTPTTAGDTTVLVTARDPAGLLFTQSITVRVLSAGTTAGSGGSGGSGSGPGTAPALTPTTSSSSKGCGLGGGVGVMLLGALALIAGSRRRYR